MNSPILGNPAHNRPGRSRRPDLPNRLRPGLLPAMFAAALLAPETAASQRRHLTVQDAVETASVSSPRLSPDGTTVAYVVSRASLETDERSSRLMAVPFAGGEPWPLTGPERSVSHPRFAPDGGAIAFLSSADDGKTQIFLLPTDGGEARRLTDLPGGVSSFSWAPDGESLAVVSMDPEEEEADGKEDEKPKPLVIRRLQFKRDGRGYLDDRRRHVYVVDADDGAHRQVTFGPYDDSSPAFSPDSSEIVFSSIRPPTGDDPDGTSNSDLFLIPKGADESTVPIRLTSSEGPDRSPVWSPDGGRIAYLGNRRPELIWYATNHLYVLDRATDEITHVAASLDRNLRAPSWSEDGATLHALLEDSGNRHLASFPVAEAARPGRAIGGERDVRDVHRRGDRFVALISEPHLPAAAFAWEPGAEPRRLSRANADLLAGLRLGAVERIEFESSDGALVQGFVTFPPDHQPGVRHPTILWIHGGPVSQFSTGYQAAWQVFAANGYVVVAANPRGSSGRGEDFSKAIWADWGNLDYEDVMAAVDHVVDAGYADPDRLGVGGWSYGGILTNYVITKTGRFRAAVTGASETDYRAAYGNDHYQLQWELELGLPWENPDLYDRLSPISRVHRVTTPTLVLCGEKDWNVPLSQSENLYQSLRRLGVPTELIIYPGQSHGIRIPSFQVDRYDRWIDWFDRFVRDDEAATDAPARR